MKTKYWNVWGTGNVCSVHRTKSAAVKAAKRCEMNARASKHKIYRVTQVSR